MLYVDVTVEVLVGNWANLSIKQGRGVSWTKAGGGGCIGSKHRIGDRLVEKSMHTRVDELGLNCPNQS